MSTVNVTTRSVALCRETPLWCCCKVATITSADVRGRRTVRYDRPVVDLVTGCAMGDLNERTITKNKF